MAGKVCIDFSLLADHKIPDFQHLSEWQLRLMSHNPNISVSGEDLGESERRARTHPRFLGRVCGKNKTLLEKKREKSFLFFLSVWRDSC